MADGKNLEEADFAEGKKIKYAEEKAGTAVTVFPPDRLLLLCPLPVLSLRSRRLLLNFMTLSVKSNTICRVTAKAFILGYGNLRKEMVY